MAARVNYPVPPCPKCGWGTNRVKNTYYSEDGRIVRYRECDDCQWRWWTCQYPELSIDMGKFRIQIPTWRDPHRSRKQVKIVPVKKPD